MPPSRTLATNVAFTLLGQLAPAVAAMVAMPWLLAGLGAERLGVLSLAWVAVGAFALLDFGLGRSLTLEVARRLALETVDDIAPLVQGTLLILGLAGLAGGLALMAARESALDALAIPPALRHEVAAAVVGVAVAAPFMTVSAGLRGVLEAYGRFDLSNSVRVPLGVLTYLGPALVLPFTTSVAAAVTVLAGVRVVGTVALLALVRRQVPQGRGWHVEWRHLRDVVATGWWMNVASVAGAALAYVDRFVLGSLLSLAAVAFYATPQELIGKLTVVPVALSAVLLPALSSADARRSDDVSRLFSRGLVYTFALLLPVAAIAAALAPEWLGLWLGAEFSRESAQAAQWLLLSVVLQSLAITPLNLLQAVGRAHITAWLQVLQLPLFIAALWLVVPVAGINGAAFVWAARMLLDVTLLLVMSRRHVPEVAPTLFRWMVAIPATAAWFAIVTRVEALSWRGALLAVALLVYTVSLPLLIGAHDVARWRALIASGLRAPAR
ncbi:MAG: oligosaccharide flippase family protein [Acidobacteria bacterium]|nr:oligosaccharide flippase family protein [Acidobacteriota bacterium]